MNEAEQFIAHFDPNDSVLIRRSWVHRNTPRNDKEREVVAAISWAWGCLHARMTLYFPDGLPSNPATGELIWKVCQPATFFDDFVQRLECQYICEETGCGLARARLVNMEGTTPDVRFV